MNQKKGGFLKTVLAVIGALVVIGGIGSAMGGSDDKKDKQTFASMNPVSTDKSVNTDKGKQETKKETSKPAKKTKEKLLVEKNGVKISYVGGDDGFIFGPEIKLSIENNTKKNITVQADELNINGCMIDSLFSCDVVAGKKAKDSITLLQSDLDENEITEIKDIELKFNIINTKTFDTMFTTKTIKIKK